MPAPPPAGRSEVDTKPRPSSRQEALRNWEPVVDKAIVAGPLRKPRPPRLRPALSFLPRMAYLCVTEEMA